jgi:hypothetical protein
VCVCVCVCVAVSNGLRPSDLRGEQELLRTVRPPLPPPPPTHTHPQQQRQRQTVVHTTVLASLKNLFELVIKCAKFSRPFTGTANRTTSSQIRERRCIDACWFYCCFLWQSEFEIQHLKWPTKSQAYEMQSRLKVLYSGVVVSRRHLNSKMLGLRCTCPHNRQQATSNFRLFRPLCTTPMNYFDSVDVGLVDSNLVRTCSALKMEAVCSTETLLPRRPASTSSWPWGP